MTSNQEWRQPQVVVEFVMHSEMTLFLNVYAKTGSHGLRKATTVSVTSPDLAVHRLWITRRWRIWWREIRDQQRENTPKHLAAHSRPSSPIWNPWAKCPSLVCGFLIVWRSVIVNNVWTLALLSCLIAEELPSLILWSQETKNGFCMSMSHGNVHGSTSMLRRYPWLKLKCINGK